eukprot:305587-Amphidinium_carterae.1
MKAVAGVFTALQQLSERETRWVPRQILATAALSLLYSTPLNTQSAIKPILDGPNWKIVELMRLWEKQVWFCETSPYDSADL